MFRLIVVTLLFSVGLTMLLPSERSGWSRVVIINACVFHNLLFDSCARLCQFRRDFMPIKAHLRVHDLPWRKYYSSIVVQLASALRHFLSSGRTERAAFQMFLRRRGGTFGQWRQPVHSIVRLHIHPAQ